jgi:NADH-quinone oxidoreductase subunit M
MLNLSVLLFMPAIGALLMILLPQDQTRLIRGVAALVAFVVLGLTVNLLANFELSNSEFQFTEYFPLNPKLGSAYALGVDGLSLALLFLAALLVFVATLASFSIDKNVKGFYICVLLLEFGMLGVFLAQDWALFYIFWEVTLIPLFFLIDRWGGKRRHAASLNFVLYTMGGSVFMLLSLLAISQYDFEHQGSLMVNMGQAAKSMSITEQTLVLLGFLIGFGVKMPIFPLHGWLPLAHVEAPSPISILLSGILLKMGAYGLIRSLRMLPDAILLLQPLLVGIAIISIVYGGLLAWRQTDLKTMVAYSSLSHMGVVLLGIASLNHFGLTGAILQMLAHGLLAGALFFLVGVVYQRSGTRELADHVGIFTATPRLALLFSLSLLAAMGLPGSLGFFAEFHVVLAVLRQWPWVTALFAVSILLSAAYALRTLLVFWQAPAERINMRDLDCREMLAGYLLIVALFYLGFMPDHLVELISRAVDDFCQDLRG